MSISDSLSPMSDFSSDSASHGYERRGMEKKEKKNRKRKNGKGKICEHGQDPDHPQKPRDPEIQRQIDEFFERYEKSEGFDVPDLPIPLITPICLYTKLENPYLLEAARFAVDEQNKKLQTGRMEFIRIIKAVVHLVSPTYYLTIEVNYIGVAECMIFQAKVKDRVNKELILFREVPHNQQGD